MLKDSLRGLLENQGQQQECKLGKFIKSLDEESAEVLIEALGGGVSTMDLVRVLSSEGFPLSREFLARKRQCFKDPQAAKTCCLNKSVEGDKK